MPTLGEASSPISLGWGRYQFEMTINPMQSAPGAKPKRSGNPTLLLAPAVVAAHAVGDDDPSARRSFGTPVRWLKDISKRRDMPFRFGRFQWWRKIKWPE